ncbi:MAG TPA: hypothetical protein ACQGQH_06660 [Xylella sp.]
MCVSTGGRDVFMRACESSLGSAPAWWCQPKRPDPVPAGMMRGVLSRMSLAWRREQDSGERDATSML